MNNSPRRVRLKASKDAARTRGVARAKRALGPDAKCEACGWRLPIENGLLDCSRVRGLHGHHMVPVSEGGYRGESNVIVLCPNDHALAHLIGQYVYAKWLGEDPAITRDRLLRWLWLAENKPSKLCREITRLYRGTNYRTPTEAISISHGLSHGRATVTL